MSWTAVIVTILALTATVYLCLAYGVGYRPATTQELDALRSGHLWHVTDQVDAIIDEHGNANLDPANCSWSSRLIDFRHPWRPRQPAIFVFRARPTRAQVALHVDTARRVSIIRLDPTNHQRARIGPTRAAVALPDGYQGPAHIEAFAVRRSGS